MKIKETLTRIGIANRDRKTLTQTCHILHKKGRYFIVHFKELMMLDGHPANFDEKDRQRRDTIARLVQDWNLTKIKTPIQSLMAADLSLVTILPYNDKANWTLATKYQIGRKLKPQESQDGIGSRIQRGQERQRRKV